MGVPYALNFLFLYLYDAFKVKRRYWKKL